MSKPRTLYSIRELWEMVRAQDALFEALSGPPSKLSTATPSAVARERRANSQRCRETLEQHGLRLSP